ncbi:MAG: ATP-dependent DNA helicase DinG [Halieaceae bacterium]|nr:ATP-dependent DNA helicase DinG [Halieaceae bacterium]
MLSDAIKDSIREAYSAIVESRSLTPRWGQRQMIAEIANALGRIPGPGAVGSDLPPVCVIEAGTGTGKTIAYSVSAIPVAQARDKRLVVATATVALQEQFVNKDLPDILSSSGMDFTYALAKGRRRYVCLSKLDRHIAEGQGASSVIPLYPDEMGAPATAEAVPVYEGMLDALGRGQWDGDRDNWPESIAEPVWYGVTTDHSQCSGRRCSHINQCSFFRARDELQSADIIVTNHDLVLSDLALGGGAILPPPEESIYIFDEGHHLPDKALSHFASFCRLHSTIAWLEDSSKSLLNAAPALSGLVGMKALLKTLPAEMADTSAALEVAEQTLTVLFDEAAPERGSEEQQVRLERGRVPEDLVAVALALAGHLQKLDSGLSRLESLLEEAIDDDHAGLDKADIETWHINIGGMLSRAQGALALWQDYAVSGEDENPPRARWITLLTGAGQGGFEMRCSPVLASDILQEYLWSRAGGVVVTSATMTALNSFDRFMLHSGAPPDAIYKVVSSPFNYDQAVFAVPAMDCDPGDAAAHTGALIAQLPEILAEDEGSLVLFSSRRQMHEVYEGLGSELDGRVLMQGDYSKQELLRRHRAAIDAGSGSVVFGLASFAEGVDLPGDYCRHVVIAKIPFAVPDSPLEAALAEWVEDQGRNPFMEISVPDAALRLVQASGRLLRTEEDSGRITLMDRRILTRRYGRAILDSLPPFRRQLG